MAFKIINGNFVLISAILCMTIHSIMPSGFGNGSADIGGSFGSSNGGISQMGSRLRRPFDLQQSANDDFKAKSLLTSHVETQNQIHRLGSLANSNRAANALARLPKTTSSLLNPFELMNNPGLKADVPQSNLSAGLKQPKHGLLDRVYSDPLDVTTPDRSLSISSAITTDSGQSTDRTLPDNDEELKLNEELQRLATEILAIQHAEQQYQSAIQTLADYERNYQAKINDFQSQIHHYSSEEESIVHQKESIEHESQELASHIAQLQSVNANLQMNIKALEETHRQINSQYNALEQSSIKLNEEDQMIKREILGVEHEDMEYQHKYDELKRQFDSLQNEKNQIEVEKESLEKSKNVIELQLKTLEDQLKNEKENKKEIEKRSLDVQSKEQGVQSEIQKYKNELIALINEISDLEKLKRTVNLSIEKTKKDDLALEELTKTLKTKSDALNDRESKLDEQEKGMDKKESNCKCTKEQLAIFMDEKRAVHANQQIINGIVATAGSGQSIQNPMTFYNSMMNMNIPNPAFNQNFNQPMNPMAFGNPKLFERRLTFDVTAPTGQAPANRIMPIGNLQVPPLNIFNDPYFKTKGGFFTSH
jgi:hypothetical protein